MSLNIDHPNAPEKLWDIFYDFTQTPRPSKSEELIREYILNLAKQQGFKTKEDKIGNIVVSIPARNSNSDKTIVIQNHIDMVTDAIPGKEINFKTDPIETFIDGDWLRAKGTTLGADNGIGCAAALALMFESEISHPNLELLFTIDEETGLTGALELDPDLTRGDFILNLDTEEWGSLYVGCAGGADFDFQREFSTEDIPAGQACFKISLNHLAGGHSGVDIHRYRENSAKCLIDLINEISSSVKISISEFRAGKAHNIIPRDAYVEFSTDKNNRDKIQTLINDKLVIWKSYFSKEDQSVEITLEEINKIESVLTQESMRTFLDFMTFFPHGVHSMIRETVDSDKDPLVSVSNNCAVCILKGSKFYLLTSLRFFNRKEACVVENTFKSLSKRFEMNMAKNSEYPSWNPDFNSGLINQAKGLYKELYKDDAHIKAIHAGLECGILLDRFESPAQAISFGPTIVDAHSPDERVNIPSVTKFWHFLTSFLKVL